MEDDVQLVKVSSVPVYITLLFCLTFITKAFIFFREHFATMITYKEDVDIQLVGPNQHKITSFKSLRQYTLTSMFVFCKLCLFS